MKTNVQIFCARCGTEMTVGVVDAGATREDPGCQEVDFPADACKCPFDTEWTDAEVKAMEDAAWEAFGMKMSEILDTDVGTE